MKNKILLPFLVLLLCLPLQVLALELSVNYDMPIKCGTPTSFTVTPSGYSGDAAQCKFRIDDIRLYYTEVDALTGAKTTASEMIVRCDAGNYPYNYNAVPAEKRTFDITFCASGTYEMTIHVMDMSSSPIQTARIKFSFTVYDPDYPSIDTIADNIVAEYKRKYSDPWDLALALNDWLVNNTVYDNSYLYCNPEGVLARGKGICNSYQEAYAMLLGRAGIENAKVKALVNGGGHTWNLAKLNGHWVHIDPTWNDSDDTHFYFGVTDEMLNLTQGHAGFTTANGKKSTCPDENYYLHTGKVTQWSDRYHSAIQAKLDAGASSFTLDAGTILNSTYEDSIRKLLCAARFTSEYWECKYGHASLAMTYNPETNLFTGSVQYARYVPYTLPGNLKTVGDSAFSATMVNILTVPSGLTDEKSLAALPSEILWIVQKDSAAEAYAKSHGISFKTK